MKTAKLLIAVLLIFLINTLCVEALSLKYPSTAEQIENPKTNMPKEKDIPDMLVPPPETPKEIKKKQKENLKEQKKLEKQTKKKVERFKKSKKIKKYKYSRIKNQNKMPKTFDEYLIKSKDIKRADMQVPRASFPKDEKLVNLPNPALMLEKYNDPPGSKELDLRLLMKNRQISSTAVLSPNNQRVAYSVVYSYPTAGQVASEVFYINVPENMDSVSALRDLHTIEAERTPILKTGTDRLAQYEKKTFTILDWSEDGNKIAVMEKIGALTQGPWKTQIWTYDFEENAGYELTALREAIRYYWKQNHNLDLIDYMWDIYPLGWDTYNKDRIVVYAYAFAKYGIGEKFLGTWSIDYKNQRSELMSEVGNDFEVSINGYILKFKRE